MEMRRLRTTVGRGGNWRMASQESSVIFRKEFASSQDSSVIFGKEFAGSQDSSAIFGKDSTIVVFGKESTWRG